MLERGDNIHISVHLCNKKYKMIDEKLRRLVTYKVWLGTMWKERGDGNMMGEGESNTWAYPFLNCFNF